MTLGLMLNVALAQVLVRCCELFFGHITNYCRVYLCKSPWYQRASGIMDCFQTVSHLKGKYLINSVRLA